MEIFFKNINIMSPKKKYLFFFKDTKDTTSKKVKVVKIKSNLILLK